MSIKKTYFAMCNKLQVHLPHKNWLKHVPFYSWVFFYCVYVSQLPYPFICQWTSGCIHVLAIVNSASMNNGVHVSLSILVSLGVCPGVGLLGHMAVLFPGFCFVLFCFFKRNIHTAVQAFIPTTSMRVSFFPHPFQHLLLVDILIMDILTSVIWYSLIMSDIYVCIYI